MSEDTLEEYIANNPNTFHGTSIGLQLARLGVPVGLYIEIMAMWLRHQDLQRKHIVDKVDLREHVGTLEYIAHDLQRWL